jgi:MFS transporter, DHA3 family, macrolide efflux protein
MKQMIEVFRNRNYLRLFLAQVASQMGTVTGMVAFAFYLLDRFASQPYYATITEMMYSLPTLAVFFLVGVLADRMDRQTIAANCDWICAGLTVGLLVAIGTGWMPLIFALLFIRSAVIKFFQPAQAALVQGVLSKEQQTSAVGLNQMVGSLFALFGSGLAALCYWNFGVQGAIVVDLLSFLASALLIRSCQIPQEARLPNGRTKWRDLNLNTVFSDFKIGSVYILRHKLLFALILGLLILGVVNGALSVLPMFMLKYVLAPDDYQKWLVGFSIAFGLGMLVGSPLATMLTQKMKPYTEIIAGFLLSGTAMILIGAIPELWAFFTFFFVFGITVPLVNVPWFGWINRIVDPKMMGRVQGWNTPLMLSSQSLTLALIAWLFPNSLSVQALYYVVGGCMFLIAVYYLLVLPRLHSRYEAQTAAESHQSKAEASPQLQA